MTTDEVLFGDDRLPARFWAKVVADSLGCWIWTGAQGGIPTVRYGVFKHEGKLRGAHRLAYHALVGPVDLDTARGRSRDHVHHHCRNTLCVNPAHLELVLAADHLGHQHRDKTHCPHGHPYDEANTRRTAAGWRACRTCERARAARTRARRARAVSGP